MNDGSQQIGVAAEEANGVVGLNESELALQVIIKAATDAFQAKGKELMQKIVGNVEEDGHLPSFKMVLELVQEGDQRSNRKAKQGKTVVQSLQEELIQKRLEVLAKQGQNEAEKPVQ